jgi:hypothetical protein
VWIGDHYYTFSRFLVSRVLAVTKVYYLLDPLIIVREFNSTS